MKTKEEWFRGLNSTDNKLEFIAAIQLDAQRAAYTECAEIVRTDPACEEGRNAAVNALNAARDSLKLP